jgi:hypothetical protein
MSQGQTPEAPRAAPPSANPRTARGERAARPRSKRSGRRGPPDPARTEWQSATYEERGSHLTVSLNGRITTVHPLWRERFQPLRWEDLRAVSPALSRLKDWLLEVLIERPVEIVIEKVGDREVARVVREVDLFDLVVFLRLSSIPVHELPGTADVERFILLDGFVEPVIRALVTRPDRVVASIAKAEETGKPLIVPKERSRGAAASALTREDLSRLLGRDPKTLRKLESHLRRPGKAGRRPRSMAGPRNRAPVAPAGGRAPGVVPPGLTESPRSIEGGESTSLGPAGGPREPATEGRLPKGDPRGVSARVPDPRDGDGMDSGRGVGPPQKRKRATPGPAKETAGKPGRAGQLELTLVSGNTATPAERRGADEAP